jgi:hypothetical protein
MEPVPDREGAHVRGGVKICARSRKCACEMCACVHLKSLICKDLQTSDSISVSVRMLSRMYPTIYNITSMSLTTAVCGPTCWPIIDSSYSMSFKSKERTSRPSTSRRGYPSSSACFLHTHWLMEGQLPELHSQLCFQILPVTIVTAQSVCRCKRAHACTDTNVHTQTNRAFKEEDHLRSVIALAFFGNAEMQSLHPLIIMQRPQHNENKYDNRPQSRHFFRDKWQHNETVRVRMKSRTGHD